MSIFERMTQSKEATTKFRAYCTEKKKEVWEALIENSTQAKNIEKVYDATTALQRAEQEIKVFALQNGVGKPDIEHAAELVFPIVMEEVMIKVLRPYFLSHWTTFRRITYNPQRKLDNGIDLNEAMYTDERKDEYHRYLQDFKAFVYELMNGVMNARRHMHAAIGFYIRELVASQVLHEMKAFDGELRCSWLQECMESLRLWSDHIGLQDAFHLISETVYRDVFRHLSVQSYQMVAVDFPEKFRSIITIKYCLQKTNNFGRESLTKDLIYKVEDNLLVASVDTKSILKAYANCVEALREMDSSCVVMHKVCGVIREYLKKRPDTVQQIISYITSNKKDELEKDMSKTVRSAMMDEEELRGVNDDFLPENMETMGWESWKPNPIDTTVGDGAPGRQGVDVFNMLVSVYGSKELFVKEYRNLLAERLSGSENKDPYFEKRYLDLLKLRFQYSELQHCEVMLRDVMHSQEVDAMIESQKNPDLLPVSACIISSHYWPKLDAEKGTIHTMPDDLQMAMENYQQMFLDAKRDRRLEWKSSVGCMELVIELDGVLVERVLQNVHAVVLFLFLEKETWTTSEVVAKLELTFVTAKRRLEWLSKQGFITVNPIANSDTWQLTRNPATILPNRPGSPDAGEDEDIEQEESSDMVEQLEQYWNYTMNFIKNHAQNGEVKAERMHRVFRMFGSPTSAGPSLDHVSQFLQRKVALGLLTCVNGSYRCVLP